ncbi:NAD(P)H-dependent oxidoreductase [Alteromonadaceae bacterium BrNp21-10]|nr:NAD(P)H-dependent oxidoreductase [Alteromonadaceae bacterium BrNp21-10]
MDKLNLLALSGSLRQQSYNTETLKALALLAPAQVDITLANISELPLFNPDIEGQQIPALASLKAAVKNADGLIIASPEYAHGISAPMKNTLDWLVSGDEFPNKSIMLINTSPRAYHALDALKEVLTTMSGIIIDDAYVAIPLLGTDLITADIIANSPHRLLLNTGLAHFISAIAHR